MKHTLLPAGCLLVITLSVFGQSESDYSTWMKTAAASSGMLRKNLEAKNKDAATADARKAEEAFKQIQDYWNKKKVDDAAKLAMDAASGYKEVADQANADNFEEAAASLRKASSTCGTCHTAHRERTADGSWKIK